MIQCVVVLAAPLLLVHALKIAVLGFDGSICLAPTPKIASPTLDYLGLDIRRPFWLGKKTSSSSTQDFLSHPHGTSVAHYTAWDFSRTCKFNSHIHSLPIY